MKSSASFRLYSKSSGTTTGKSLPHEIAYGEYTAIHHNSVSTSSSITSATSQGYVPIPQQFLRQPLEDFDSPNRHVSFLRVARQNCTTRSDSKRKKERKKIKYEMQF